MGENQSCGAEGKVRVEKREEIFILVLGAPTTLYFGQGIEGMTII